LGPGEYAGFVPYIAARKPAENDANKRTLSSIALIRILITEVPMRIGEGHSINLSMDGGVGKVSSS
jgi:hypothetical protein